MAGSKYKEVRWLKDFSCAVACADFHKLGGIEVLLEALGENNSKPLRAAAANALAVAASNNEEFSERLWIMWGPEVLQKLLQVRQRERVH